jgi:predicted PurR-regulated permease PerM
LSLVVYTIFLLLLRVPYAIILGLVGGAMEFIPLAGPLVAALVILGVAFLTGYHHLLAIALFLAAWRLVQDYVSSPRIMGGKLELHPLAALFAILTGGEIAGVIGVYLSIPITATLRILWKRWQKYSATDDAAKDSG